MQPQRPAQLPVPPKMTKVERLDVPETFADSLGKMTFDGMNAKLEFVVNWFDEPTPGQVMPSGKAISACRLILPIGGVLQLYAQLTNLVNSLQAQGALKQIPLPTQSGPVN
jgi:hypothetical protein